MSFQTAKVTYQDDENLGGGGYGTVHTFEEKEIKMVEDVSGVYNDRRRVFRCLLAAKRRQMLAILMLRSGKDTDYDDDNPDGDSGGDLLANAAALTQGIKRGGGGAGGGGDDASSAYNDEYRSKIAAAAGDDDTTGATAFIGFGLVDDPRSSGGAHRVKVSFVYQGGPADQVGIHPGTYILAIGGEPVKVMQDVTKLIKAKCKIREFTPFTIQRFSHTGNAASAVASGNMQQITQDHRRVVDLWIMTADKQFAGKPYYFDRDSTKKIEK